MSIVISRRYERQLLGARLLLDFALSSERLGSGHRTLGIQKAHGSAGTGVSCAACARVVLPDAALHLRGDARVERVVRTADHIDVPASRRTAVPAALGAVA
jgi:hypothetical protein